MWESRLEVLEEGHNDEAMRFSLVPRCSTGSCYVQRLPTLKTVIGERNLVRTAFQNVQVIKTYRNWKSCLRLAYFYETRTLVKLNVLQNQTNC